MASRKKSSQAKEVRPAGPPRSQRSAARDASAAIAQQAALADAPLAALAAAAAGGPGRAKRSGNKKRTRTPSPPLDDPSTDDVSEASDDQKRQRGAAAAQATTSSNAAALHCKACFSSFNPSTLLEGAFCTACKLFPSFAFDHPINQQRFAAVCGPLGGSTKSTGAPGPGVASATSGAAGQSTTPKLSAYETELRRLAELAHTPRELYTRPDAVAHADALARILDRTYRGALFAKQSHYLTQLIRSGQFRHLPLALPRLNTEVLAAEEQEAKRSKQALRINAADSTITLGGAEISTRDMGSLSMRDFMQVFVTAIVPSLIDRPAALLDWTLLVRSALAIEEERGWAAASAYVRNHLHRCVANCTDVGPFDKALWDDIRAELPLASPARPESAPTTQQAARSSTSSDSIISRHTGGASVSALPLKQMKPRSCRHWNGILPGKSSCVRDKCTWKHECCWAACASSKTHRGVDCVHNPYGVGQIVPPSSSADTTASASQQSLS